MKICVDTSILIDILKDEFQDFQVKFYTALIRNETLIIPSVVYAELIPQFKGNTKIIDQFLFDHKIKVEPVGTDSTIEAAKKWMKYLKRKTKKKCPYCKKNLNFKEHFLSDFYIGGFAIARCDAILTRDRGIFKKYFHEIKDYENCYN